MDLVPLNNVVTIRWDFQRFYGSAFAFSGVRLGRILAPPFSPRLRNYIRTGTLVRYLVYICVRTTVRIPVIVRSNNAVAYRLSNDATNAFLGT